MTVSSFIIEIQLEKFSLVFKDFVLTTFKFDSNQGDAWSVAAAASSAFGAFGDAGMQLEGSALISHSLTFEAVAIIFMLALVYVFGCRRRRLAAVATSASQA